MESYLANKDLTELLEWPAGTPIPKDSVNHTAQEIAADTTGVKGKEMKITFDDWIFKQDDKVAINRATMTKFGIKVAELTVMFVKD